MVAATPGNLGANAKTAFTRTASGLVREMSIWDAALFGLMGTGGAYSFIYLFPFPQYFNPGFSATWLIIITLLFALICYFVYAGLGSAMPRAGGDYLYETRTIHRIVGFAIPWASQVIFWLVFPVNGAYVANWLGFIPICYAFGWDGAAEWLSTPAGGTVVAVLTVLLCWWLAVGGLRLYRKVQAFVFLPFILIGLAAMIIVLLANWNADFSAAFNAYHAGSDITADAVRAAASENGYVETGFSLRATWIWIAVLAGIIPYSMYAAQGMLGEVKEASNLGRLFRAFALPGLFTAICVLLIPWALLQHTAGSEFLSQFATAYGSGAIAPDYSPNINVFVQMLEPNKWVTLLVSLGFIGGGLGIASCVVINVARVIMAMSLDGLLPSFLSRVWSRTFTPAIALTIWATLSAVIAVWYNYGDLDLVLAILAAGMVTSTFVVGVTLLGGALFPYTAPDIYISAPVRRWQLGGIPVITILGAIGFAWVMWMLYYVIFAPELGLTYSTPRIFLAVSYASGFVIYFIWQAIMRGRGVDVSLTTREVPPE